MNHAIETKTIDGRQVIIYSESDADNVIFQPVDTHDMEEMDNEIEYIEKNTDKKFILVAVRINKWNDELTPWSAPPVFGRIPFGDGAGETLRFITDKLIPRYDGCRFIIGGYSLAGLFALWSSWQKDAFSGVVAASPSVWYKDWLDYAEEGRCKAGKVYLSLGDREYHSKNKLMATINEAIARQTSILDAQAVENTFEWNPGNHFIDNGVRTAKGFCWTL